MAPRSELRTLLRSIPGVVATYFQPPPDHQMLYPCIVYERDRIRTTFANNKPYRFKKRYSVTVIDENPDSEIPDLVAEIPTCTHDQHFTVDNMNHDAFTLFF